MKTSIDLYCPNAHTVKAGTRICKSRVCKEKIIHVHCHADQARRGMCVEVVYLDPGETTD